MAATAWSIYNLAKKYLGEGVIKLGVDVFNMQLHTSLSNASTYTLDAAGSLTGEVAPVNGYLAGGKTLASVTWGVGASAKQYKFDSADPIWTAGGGAILNVKFAVIRNAAGKLLCWSRLTTAQFTLAENNTLTVQNNPLGIFTLA